MSYYIFVDNSNVWIEGKYHSAINKGFAANIYEAHENAIQDNSWAIDFGNLLYEVSDGNVTEIKEAVLFGSKPTDKDSLWNAIRKAGFTVHNIDRNVANKEKKVDTGIVAEILKTLYKKAKENDIFVLVMGDSDFVPAVKQINEAGVKSACAFWNNVSGELRTACDCYICLNDIFDNISFK